uniref:Uncharacterized protein n=1 Tax=Anguilla anguilla TaxID=7936 RepID=A0A0E9U221_ANGAN
MYNKVRLKKKWCFNQKWNLDDNSKGCGWLIFEALEKVTFCADCI